MLQTGLIPTSWNVKIRHPKMVGMKARRGDHRAYY